MLWKKGDKASAKGIEYTALIDEGSEIDGKLTFSGTVVLNGKFRGEIVSTDSLIVGENGVINASIHAGIVQIAGEVVGDVSATERVELRGQARVYGDVEAPVVVMEEGVLFEGHCRMSKARPVEVVQQPPARVSAMIPLKRSEAPR